MTRLSFCAFFLGLCVSSVTVSSLSAATPESGTSVNTENEVSTPAAVNQRSIFTNYDVSNVQIQTYDKLQLNARLYNPKASAFPGPRPTLIFANSWALSKYEYEVQAREFAADGYVVLSYATRGFGGSDGTVTVGGSNDIHDISTLVDWLEDNTRVDVANIGMAGISYGAGLSLLALAHEPRIKTAAAMSGWGNLEESLFRNETVQNTWLQLLLGSGVVTGHLDADIWTQVAQMRDRTDIAATKAWAASRSVESFVDLINARKAPVFLENSYLDALFPPLQIRPFYEKLEGPKRMAMDEGVHASASISGVLGLPNETWIELHAWMNHFLIDDSLPVKTGISFHTSGKTESYADYPTLKTSSQWKLAPLNSLSKDSAGHSVVHFTGNKDSGATSGIPLASDLLTALVDVPVKKIIGGIDRRYAAVYQTPSLRSDITVRGAPRLGFTVMPHQGPVTLVGYLYDVDFLGVGTLVSYSVMSLVDEATQAVPVNFDLNITAFSVSKGHSLVFAIDTVDSLYSPATTDAYTVDIAANPGISLSLPTVK